MISLSINELQHLKIGSMKRLSIILFLFSNCFGVQSQNLFKIGLKHFKNGDFQIADSLFVVYLKDNPEDINAHYNHGVVSLYLRDTTGFCEEMLMLRNNIPDKSIDKQYFKICGSLETFYLDNNYLTCIRENARFTEVIETYKYLDFKTVIVHDKKNKGKTTHVYLNDIMNPEKTDIIAVYQLKSDGSKLFLYCENPASFPGGNAAHSEFRDKFPLIQQVKNLLHLHEVVTDVQYIVDKKGNINDIKFLRVQRGKVKQLEELKKWVIEIISKMPIQIPASYQDKNVDYLVNDFLSFW